MVIIIIIIVVEIGLGWLWSKQLLSQNGVKMPGSEPPLTRASPCFRTVLLNQAVFV